MHHPTKLVHRKMQRLVTQRVLFLPTDVADGGGVVMDLQPVRPQIQHPLHRAATSANHEIVRHFLNPFETAATFTPVLATTRSSLVMANTSTVVLTPTVALVAFVTAIFEIARTATRT